MRFELGCSCGILVGFFLAYGVGCIAWTTVQWTVRIPNKLVEWCYAICALAMTRVEHNDPLLQQ